MKAIPIIIFIMLLVSCADKENEEIQIINTVCIDGVLNFSIVDHGKCFYAPVTIEGEIVRCP